MDRRTFLKVLASFGVAIPAAALAPRASARVVEAAARRLDGTPWWQPVVRTWCSGVASPALDALCDALEVPEEVFECSRADVAIARLLLGPIQQELPSWWFGDVNARDPFPARLDGTPLFRPQHLATINWADSGPGFSWPEAFHATVIGPLDVVVVTASRDCDEPMGCTDHALGWRPATRPVRDIAREVLVADWKRRKDGWDQDAWENIFSPGLFGERQLRSMRRQAWGRRHD
jgi:hypothetical protein